MFHHNCPSISFDILPSCSITFRCYQSHRGRSSAFFIYFCHFLPHGLDLNSTIHQEAGMAKSCCSACRLWLACPSFPPHLSPNKRASQTSWLVHSLVQSSESSVLCLVAFRYFWELHNFPHSPVWSLSDLHGLLLHLFLVFSADGLLQRLVRGFGFSFPGSQRFGQWTVLQFDNGLVVEKQVRN